MWNNLLTTYDNLIASGESVCPIAYKLITAHVLVLLDRSGKYLFSMKCPVSKAVIAVPCTIQSESRSNKNLRI